MQEEKKYIRLDEVTLMRTILAVLIVFMHSFTCYHGSWPPPAGYVEVPAYFWLTRISFAFSLEAFVFVSGYLFAFQRITLNRTYSGLSLTINKIKRLILPSIIFSIAYFVIFYPYKGIANAALSILNGCGHMWYLPMLFWCFIGGYLLEKVKIHDCWKIAFLIVLNLLSVAPLPLRLSVSTSYLFYWFIGYIFYKNSEKLTTLITPQSVSLLWVAFAILFVVLRPLRDVLAPSSYTTLGIKAIVLVGNHACQLVYATAGLFAFYGTAFLYTKKHTLSKITVRLAACCFGIYLFQQFILQLLYYKTEFPLLAGPYLLPWCGFVIAAIVSFIFSVLLLKTKVGRSLIG